MNDHIFVGFGFGPIQSALFAAEAFKSGRFERIVIAEIDQGLVEAVRGNKGAYHINVAGSEGVGSRLIEGMEIYNPNVDADKTKLIQAIGKATEIVTSLPSVKFYDMGDAGAAKLIAAGLRRNTRNGVVIYAAENNNHAAEILRSDVGRYVDIGKKNVQFLNTVIGKMSQVVAGDSLIQEKRLAPIATGLPRAFLVEEFNRILVTRTTLKGFAPGISVFIEKDDLLPFEEAKLYGHNAIHALLAYMGLEKGYQTMDQLRGDNELMRIARDAFIKESGGALIRKYASLGDELFSKTGYTKYADDLLERMTNRWLGDSVARAARDPVRKLGYNDRIFGTMRLAMEYGIEPVNMAKGAAAGLKALLAGAEANGIPAPLRFNCAEPDSPKLERLLGWLWQTENFDKQVLKYIIL